MSMIGKSRQKETAKDSLAENEFNYWQAIVENPENLDGSNGDTFKATFGFSSPQIENLEKLKIPVLVVYGTKDYSSIFNDFLRVDVIRKHKTNFTFIPKIGLEHNFFGVKENGEIDYGKDNWTKIASEWQLWLEK